VTEAVEDSVSLPTTVETDEQGAASTDYAAVTSLKRIETTKVSRFDRQFVSDDVSVEEPLEIRLETMVSGDLEMHQIAVTMRTPGNDRELAAGFLFTEGIVSHADDIEEIVSEKCNVVNVRLKENVEVNSALFERHSFVASSCGICGKKSIAAVRVKRQYASAPDAPIISALTVHGLSEALREFQDNFNHTGGIHASSLFDTVGKLLNVKEDVGRHNALDKVIGAEFLSGALPLNQRILMVSGRTSFELVQKAAHAGIAIIAAVGAPSSLAVELAKECGITLIGFMRDDRFNVYTGLHRITDLPEQQ
jgi:FdhD protein